MMFNLKNMSYPGTHPVWMAIVPPKPLLLPVVRKRSSYDVFVSVHFRRAMADLSHTWRSELSQLPQDFQDRIRRVAQRPDRRRGSRSFVHGRNCGLDRCVWNSRIRMWFTLGESSSIKCLKKGMTCRHLGYSRMIRLLQILSEYQGTTQMKVRASCLESGDVSELGRDGW